ncbi:hypothetical protein FQA47_025596 [Oryzias melastigma]|uniref:Uncharacterized protein n=1 Tax=Oryzias melastigma TaxID=30732 RepID=A0A834FBX6_ORYME|nr:hypothetical protein FQA47_025596 [Oryzias melastigma]
MSSMCRKVLREALMLGELCDFVIQVYLSQMPAEYLINTVCRETMVRRNARCAAMVTRTLRALCNSYLERPLDRARSPAEVLLAIGHISTIF